MEHKDIQLPETPGYDFQREPRYDYNLFTTHQERVGAKANIARYEYNDHGFVDSLPPEDQEKLASYKKQYGLAAGSAMSRDHVSGIAQEYKNKGWLSALKMGATYVASIAGITYSMAGDNLPVVSTLALGAILIASIGGKKSDAKDYEQKTHHNFAFQRSRKYLSASKDFKLEAQAFDREVFMLNGCNMTQCTFKETQQWADSYKKENTTLSQNYQRLNSNKL